MKDMGLYEDFHTRRQSLNNQTFMKDKMKYLFFETPLTPPPLVDGNVLPGDSGGSVFDIHSQKLVGVISSYTIEGDRQIVNAVNLQSPAAQSLLLKAKNMGIRIP